MTKLTKEHKERINQYILDGITSEEEVLTTNKEKLQYALKRFRNEYGHEIKRVGVFSAYSSWLQGLALDYEYYNCDILDLAREWGQNPTTESQEEKILLGYWDFLTNATFKLCKQYKIEVQ